MLNCGWWVTFKGFFDASYYLVAYVLRLSLGD